MPPGNSSHQGTLTQAMVCGRPAPTLKRGCRRGEGGLWFADAWWCTSAAAYFDFKFLRRKKMPARGQIFRLRVAVSTRRGAKKSCMVARTQLDHSSYATIMKFHHDWRQHTIQACFDKQTILVLITRNMGSAIFIHIEVSIEKRKCANPQPTSAVAPIC